MTPALMIRTLDLGFRLDGMNRKEQKPSSMPDCGFDKVVLAMSERTIKTVTLKDYKARLLRVLVHIQQRLDDPLSLEDLARLASFSPFHFHRVFTGMLGESVQNHIRRLRLERAASRLKTGNQQVVQVALDAGYETHEAFTRAFKSQFGVSPSRYRLIKQPSAGKSKRVSNVHYCQESVLTHFKIKRETSMNVNLKTLQPMRVAFVRHVGPYASCHLAWDKLCPFMGKEGLLGPNTLFVGICHDDPDVTPPDKIRYDACVTVDADFQPQGEIGVQTISGGEYAVTTHAGPYEKLNETYAKIMGQWLPRSGRDLRSVPCFEIYLNDPNSTAPEDLLTDIHVPLASKH